MLLHGPRKLDKENVLAVSRCHATVDDGHSNSTDFAGRVGKSRLVSA